MPTQSESVSFLSIESYITQQNKAFLRDFSTSGMCLVAVSSRKLIDMKRFWGWTIEQLPGCLSTSAFIVRKSGNFDPECWVRWDYRDYRKAFSSYLCTCHPRFNPILNANVQVDHLEPRFRFTKSISREGEYFVRLHLMKRYINAAYGAGFEKSFYQSERTMPLHGAIHMSWLGFCKAYGILPPGKNSGTEACQAWARKVAKDFAKETGEEASSAYAGLLSVLQLGYTGHYSGGEPNFDFDALRQSFLLNY